MSGDDAIINDCVKRKVCPGENRLKYEQRKFARLITQHRDIFFPIFRKARPSFFRVLQRMTKVFNVTSLKYGKYDITNEKINQNNKRLIDRAR